MRRCSVSADYFLALLARYDVILIEDEFCHSIWWTIAPRRVIARLDLEATIALVPTSVHRQRPLRLPAAVNSIPILNSSCLISFFLVPFAPPSGSDRHPIVILGSDAFPGMPVSAPWAFAQSARRLRGIPLAEETVSVGAHEDHFGAKGQLALWEGCSQLHPALWRTKASST